MPKIGLPQQQVKGYFDAGHINRGSSAPIIELRGACRAGRE
jgi:hypothetical protein